MRVLLVEDDVKIARAIERGLRRQGITVECSHDGLDGLWRATESPFDVIVLDIMLPGLNGFQVCQRLRAAGNWTPLLFLTAKSGELDEAEGLDTGADDYLSKPFSFGVLVARLHALGRRSSHAIPDCLQVGDVLIDGRRRTVIRNGNGIEFTSREFDVLSALVRRPNVVLSKSDLLDAVWSSDFDGDPNVVEVYVARIRRKLAAPNPDARGSLIETVRGAGYRFRTDE
jgi:two-component system, OmpR family, response regulator